MTAQQTKVRYTTRDTAAADITQRLIDSVSPGSPTYGAGGAVVPRVPLT